MYIKNIFFNTVLLKTMTSPVNREYVNTRSQIMNQHSHDFKAAKIQQSVSIENL